MTIETGRCLVVLFGLLCGTHQVSADRFELIESHPRVLISSESLVALADNCKGPLAKEYAQLKANADRAVRTGEIRFIDNKWAVPADLMACGMVYLVERQNGNRDASRYAQPIIACWGDGSRITNKTNSAFGYHALAYDWIYDVLDAEQRTRFGNALGSWLKWYTGESAITLKSGHWEYNQTWGVSHMNVMHARDAIAQKLFISLAIAGAGTDHETEAQQFLNSWADRIPRECIPAFDAMGGSWAESHGHGSYGPIQIIPWTFEAWRSATGQNWFTLGEPSTYLKEMSRWLTYLTVPHSGLHAYIDDGGGSRWSSFESSAPVIAKALNDPLAQRTTNQAFDEGAYQGSRIWQRLLMDPTVAARTPGEMQLPLGYLFKGAGHVFMRSGWDGPNETWAFFGAGRHVAGHQHDDEGHFLISRQGGLVSKGGGKGLGNDSDHYWGGSLVFNVITIFDPRETFRRSNHNENDGGLRRLVYHNGKAERGHLTAFQHNDDFTYAAADLTKAYSSEKAREVTRQFVYLRNRQNGGDEYFVVFDRVHSTKAEFAKHFMLHMPEEPQVSGVVLEKVAGHVFEHTGANMVSTWVSMPHDFGDKVTSRSTGKSRVLLRTVLPRQTVITKRGGDGHKNWGHPLEASAQYDHHNHGRDQPPVCRWRLEIAAPPGERSYFLHVFQVTDEGTREMSDLELTEHDGSFNIQIGTEWEVTFAKSGVPSGRVRTAAGRVINWEHD